ncbi:hypothetical protein OIU79_029123 [Salix purpurea]|uniref:Uncharacterized protein n=1 Tax=Salix purpurea TaxID=77065 RepID=A0A9Q0SBZ0_SALPP|nr:hypothetical protein OIU79_029123 [Salix purpurea]
MATDKGKNPTNQSTKSQTNTWAAKVKIIEASTRFTLDPIPRCEGVHPKITMDMLTDNVEQWTHYMVGVFPGFRMNYHTVNTIANRVWRSGGLEDVMSTAIAKVSIDATTLDPKPKPVTGKKPLGQSEKENGTTQSSSSQPPLNKTNPKAPKDSRPTTKDA